MRWHHGWVIMVLGRSLWEEPGSGIHRYSPTSTRSSWLMSRWYYFPRSWQGCLADLLGSPTEFLDGGWRNSFMPRGTLFSRNKASRHKLCKVTFLLSNKQMVLRAASCLPYIGCPTNTCGISSSVSDVRASIREWEPPSCQLETNMHNMGAVRFIWSKVRTLIWRQHFGQLWATAPKR